MTINWASPGANTPPLWSGRSETGLLHPGETLLWFGHPDLPRYARAKSLTPSLVGIAFLCLIVPGALRSDGNSFGALFFMTISALLALSPLWHLARGRWTTYVLTDKRAMINIAGILPRRIIVPFSAISHIDVHAPGSTTNDIGDIVYVPSRPAGDGETRPIGFYAVPDVKNVEQIFRKAIEDRQRSMFS
jgi:hypothetical protein